MITFFLLKRKKKAGKNCVGEDDNHMRLLQPICKTSSFALFSHYSAIHLGDGTRRGQV